jgi:hypothetical protein
LQPLPLHNDKVKKTSYIQPLPIYPEIVVIGIRELSVPTILISMLTWSGDTDPQQRAWFNESTKLKGQVEGLVRPVIEHLDKLEGKVSGNDPNNPWNKNDWKKHLQKALNNISEKLKKLGKPFEQVLKERGWTKEAIENIVKRITNNGFDIPKGE